MKRSGKFYRDNEAEVMKALGLRPTKNSGSGWIEKEDGENDNVICQLKSTDAASISVKLQDIHTLQYNADVSHKIPVFAVQFLSTGETFLLISPQHICDVAQYLETGEKRTDDNLLGDITKAPHKSNKRVIASVGSSENARVAFYQKEQQKRNKFKSAK